MMSVWNEDEMEDSGFCKRSSHELGFLQTLTISSRGEDSVLLRSASDMILAHL